MKILSLDSSAVCATVAVGSESKIISEFSINAGLTHSKTLLPMIDSALTCAGLSLFEIDAIACSIGPGSFTGLRIGIATAKGLAAPAGLPCIPLSTLESLAYNLIGNDCICVCVMDARCNQVYTATFNVNYGKIERLTPDEAISIDELGQHLMQYNKRIVFTGDGAELVHKELGYDIAPLHLRFQNASSVSMNAFFHFDDAVNANELQPVYLRLPQAERELKARQSPNK